MPIHRKRFGQHFLQDPAIIERIITEIDPKPDQVLVEIGPGRGALTLPLLDRGGRLHAIELDRDLAARLPAIAAGRGELTLHQADAVTFDFTALAVGKRLRVVGNLPYNISTPLLFHLIDQIDAIEDMTFMLQKEVADRLAAAPRSKAYGRLSVMIQWRCNVELLFDVSPDAFVPPPKVYSSVLCLRPRPSPLAVGDAQRFHDIVQAAFGQRRKTLRNSLRLLLDEVTFERAGIDSRRRAEELSLEEFVQLARA
jgi:16S rRNA (adenine1518-N6/adenine1519-N6)-dimethyltransferase